MIRLARAALLLLLPPLAASAANPRSISIAIQENGRAQISETHDLPPPGRDGLVRIAPLPETLLPASVDGETLDADQPLAPLSQRFVYDLRNPEALFRAHLDRPVAANVGGNTFSGRLASLPDFSSPSPSLLLAADGLSWSASHQAILAADARSISLSTRVLLRNDTLRDFPGARIRLALSDKGRYAPLVPDAGDPRANRPPVLRYAPDGKSWIPERAAAAFAAVATYDVPHPLTLPAQSDVRAGLAFADAIPVETRHVYDGVRFDRYQRSRRTDPNLGTESSPAVETRLVFRNESSAPLPPGEFRLLRGAADRALEWIGHDWLPPLAPGESASLNLGPAAGLSGRRVRTAYAEIVPFKSSEESFEITLDNQTGADQTVVVVERLYRGDAYEIVAANVEQTPGNAPNSIEFLVPVKNGSQRVLSYTVRYAW
jgi:hypothetical protein